DMAARASVFGKCNSEHAGGLWHSAGTALGRMANAKCGGGPNFRSERSDNATLVRPASAACGGGRRTRRSQRVHFTRARHPGKSPRA
ncbi:unnamed protein product, partial [Polarella glacialis]